MGGWSRAWGCGLCIHDSSVNECPEHEQPLQLGFTQVSQEAPLQRF